MSNNKITIGEIIRDQLFIDNVSKKLREELKKRRNRPEPKTGFKYKRDWHDRMEVSMLTTSFFLESIPLIWSKKSNLNAEKRNVIKFVCDHAFRETLAQKAKHQLKPKQLNNEIPKGQY